MPIADFLHINRPNKAHLFILQVKYRIIICHKGISQNPKTFLASVELLREDFEVAFEALFCDVAFGTDAVDVFTHAYLDAGVVGVGFGEAGAVVEVGVAVVGIARSVGLVVDGFFFYVVSELSKIIIWHQNIRSASINNNLITIQIKFIISNSCLHQSHGPIIRLYHWIPSNLLIILSILQIIPSKNNFTFFTHTKREYLPINHTLSLQLIKHHLSLSVLTIRSQPQYSIRPQIF